MTDSPATATATKSACKPRCSASTHKGRKCKLKCIPGESKQCWIHTYRARATKECPRYTIPDDVLAYLDTAPADDANAWATGEYAPQKAPGLGQLCEAQIFKTKKEGLYVYRLSSKSTVREAIGGWWSLKPPDCLFGSEEEWRAKNAVCVGWSGRHPQFVLACQLPAGVLVSIGPGQSADCRDPNINSSPLDTDRETVYKSDGTLQVTFNYFQAMDMAGFKCDQPRPIEWGRELPCSATKLPRKNKMSTSQSKGPTQTMTQTRLELEPPPNQVALSTG